VSVRFANGGAHPAAASLAVARSLDGVLKRCRQDQRAAHLRHLFGAIAQIMASVVTIAVVATNCDRRESLAGFPSSGRSVTAPEQATGSSGDRRWGSRRHWRFALAAVLLGAVAAGVPLCSALLLRSDTAFRANRSRLKSAAPRRGRIPDRRTQRRHPG
jgi:uncharacterized membrane protein